MKRPRSKTCRVFAVITSSLVGKTVILLKEKLDTGETALEKALWCWLAAYQNLYSWLPSPLKPKKIKYGPRDICLLMQRMLGNL